MRCPSLLPHRSSGASGPRPAISPLTGRSPSGGTGKTQCCCQKSQRRKRRSKLSVTEGRLNRADLLKAGGVGVAALTVARRLVGGLMKIEATTLNMLTWSDHYANDQLKAVGKATG